MKFFLFALFIFFSFISYSQDRCQTITKINDSIVSDGYVYESENYPKVVVLKTDNMKVSFENVVPGDYMEDYYSLYSKDDIFRFDFYDFKVIVYVINESKNFYMKQYLIELK
jgi:hypothetical protein